MKDDTPPFETIPYGRQQEVKEVFKKFNESGLPEFPDEPDDYYGIDRPYREFTVLRYKGLKFRWTSNF